jgi:hypothetical protein
MTARSRERKRPPARIPPATAAPGRAVGRARSRTAVLVGGVAAVVVIALVALQRWQSRGHGAGAASDEAATMDARTAAGRGVELGQGGRHVASLPYFRRAAELGTGWVGHWNYAAALNNAAFEVWSRHGVASPASRSAVERLELVRSALAEVEAAEHEAPDARTHAMMELVRGNTLEMWGFPVDALEAYRSARSIDPEYPAARRSEAQCIAALRGEPPPAAKR